MRTVKLSDRLMQSYHGCGAAMARIVDGVAVDIRPVASIAEKDAAEEVFGEAAEFGLLSATEFCLGREARQAAMEEIA